MKSTPQNATKSTQRGQCFKSTLWSVVLQAKQANTTDEQAALEQLCQAYWYPIYAYVRRWGCEREAAKDMTQSFFAYVLGKKLFKEATPEKGRFRSFLLVTLKNFMHNTHRRELAQKRGGNETILSLDAQLAEERYALEPATNIDPENLFDQRWAWEVLRQAFKRLESEYGRAGKAAEFSVLQPCISANQETNYQELAKELNKTVSAVRTAVSRLRIQFRETIHQVVADTVTHPNDVDSELQDLKVILQGN